MNYIDALYSDLFPEQKRKLAAEQDNFNQKNTLSSSDLAIGQKQTEPISRSFNPMTIKYPAGYKVQSPQSEIMRENVNEALLRQQQEQENLSKGLSDVYKEKEGYKASLQDVLKRLQGVSSEQYSAPEVDAQIKDLQQQSATPELPERSTFADVISLFGAPLLGAMTGEAGALAQMPAAKASRDIYEGAAKSNADRVKLLKENTEQKLKSLIDLKKSGQESFDKNQARQLEKIKAELGATKDLASMSSEELKSKEERLFKLNDSIAKQFGEYASSVSKSESATAKEESMPLDKKKMVEKYAGEVARITGIRSQVDELKNQIADKSISEDDRLASALEQLKLLNSTLGADAVGAEETKRMAAFLDPMPNWVKKKPGIDLDGFYRQLDRSSQRLGGSISAQQKEIDRIYGRTIKEDQKKEIKGEIIERGGRKFVKKPNGKYEEVL